MDIQIYQYLDSQGKCYEVFDLDNVRHDAVKCSTYDPSTESYVEFWQVRILPACPVDKARIVAQCKTMERAIEKLRCLAY